MDPVRRIYCVEDDLQVARILEKQLEYLGYQVCGMADNGPDAVKGISESSPDIALIDIELHGKFEGLDVGNFLITRTDIPFVYITAHDDRETMERARQTLPDGYLLKPFDTRQLMVAIEMAKRNGSISPGLARTAGTRVSSNGMPGPGFVKEQPDFRRHESPEMPARGLRL